MRANLPLAKLKGILCPVVPFIVNMMEETTRVVEASSDDEFSSVVIPIFPKSVVTAHEWQEVPDPSTISSTETEPADSVSETSEFSNANHESPISPTKRTRWDSNREDNEEIVNDEIHSMAEVTVADWLNFETPASSAFVNVADPLNKEDDLMWDDRLAVLVEEVEEGLRDEEAMYDTNDDEFSEVSECISYNSETFEGRDTLTRPVSSGEENEPPQTAENNDKKPLYPEATIAVGAVMVLLALFTIKHNLPAEAIQNLLTLFSLTLPSSHCLPNTVNRFKNYFKSLRNPLRIHYYCAFCLMYIESKTATTCPNGSCLQDLKKPKSLAYHIEIPILEQLKCFFSRPTFYDDVQHRFKRTKRASDNIEDVYDGQLYKELCAKGLLCYKDNISFLMNTDGVPVFKSSKVSIWPLYFIINELDYRKRLSRENMLFAGLWFGEKKPAMWTFLKPHMKALKDLESGVELESPSRGKFICKAVLLACTCDLPARCLVCNSMQYNGEYGCWKCLQAGQTVKTGPKGHVRAFPFNHADPKGPLRTNEMTLEHAKDAMQEQMAGKPRYAIKGVKGFSWLSILQHHDIIRGTAIDYMHGVLLGVQKLLLNLWFNNSYSKKGFSLYNMVSVVDERLKNISPTLDIKRLPRSISEHLKYWKANELRSFLLYYGLPVLYGLLPDEYFEHYFYFVRAIYLLLLESISEEQLKVAEQLLQQFCFKFSQLYELRYQTLNIHQLLHLVDNVRDLGPLYTHSCFSFEDKNGFVLKLIHGTQFIDSQIITAVSFTQKLPELREQCITPGSEEEGLYYELLHPNKPKRKLEILPSVHTLGSFYRKRLDDNEFLALERYFGHAPVTAEVNAFNRIEMNETLIYGLDYKRMFRRNCSTIQYRFNNVSHFAQVKCFFQLSLGTDIQNVALIYPLECCSPYNPASTHITAVTRINSLRVINIKDICRNCIYITIAGNDKEHNYVCEFANKIETD